MPTSRVTVNTKGGRGLQLGVDSSEYSESGRHISVGLLTT